MKNVLLKIGYGVSLLLMFLPIVIIYFYEQIGGYWWLLLIFSVCYDVYMYSIIKFDNEIEENKKLYFNVLNGKTIDSKSENQKLKWYQIICINILSSYYGDDFKN